MCVRAYVRVCVCARARVRMCPVHTPCTCGGSRASAATHRAKHAAIETTHTSRTPPNQTRSQVVVFIKGTKQFPQCGFSNTCVQILNSLAVPYEAVNILEDERLRSGLKEYSQWPTFPQVYIGACVFGVCGFLRRHPCACRRAVCRGMAGVPTWRV